MSGETAQNNITDQMKGYYAYSYLTLQDGNYRNAVNGFKYTLKNNIEPLKSAIGLVCAYCCMGNYRKALAVFDAHRDSLVFDKGLRHKLIRDLSYFLSRDVSALKLKRRNYFSSIRLNITMGRICEKHSEDPSGIVSVILLSYWLSYAGYTSDTTDDAAMQCLYMKTLDDRFRWKLLSRLSVENKELLLDDDLASLFSDIPEEVSSTDYINTLLLSIMYKGNLETARNNIEILRNKGQVFTNEVLWNFIKLSVEQGETDDLTVNFAKHLISEGWMDPYVAEAIRFGYANRTRYSVRNELRNLEYMNL